MYLDGGHHSLLYFIISIVVLFTEFSFILTISSSASSSSSSNVTIDQLPITVTLPTKYQENINKSTTKTDLRIPITKFKIMFSTQPTISFTTMQETLPPPPTPPSSEASPPPLASQQTNIFKERTTTESIMLYHHQHHHQHHHQQQQQNSNHQEEQKLFRNQKMENSTLLRQQISRTAAIKMSPSATNATLKNHKTDAPMLNYIFDSHLATSKHHHHDRHDPHFEHVADNLVNVTAQAGSRAYLNCRISLLQDKTVSWVKRESNIGSIQLLTVGRQTYSGDSRFSVEFQYPNNWRLTIVESNKSDEGLYECQISTYPPRVIKTFLRINAPEVIIADEHGALLVDKYCEVDSTIQLVCIVRHIVMTSSVVYWLHGERMLNFDTTRGGISVRTNLMEDGANSTLSIAKIKKVDSGNYTCSIGPNEFFTITIHVLNGESMAELYHGSSTKLHINTRPIKGVAAAICIALFTPQLVRLIRNFS